MTNPALYALDTNILSAILNAEPTAAHLSGLLQGWRSAGEDLVIHGSVYGELLALPGNSDALMQNFLQAAQTRVDWTASEALWKTASAAYSAYAQRRRRSGGAAPRRILGDFIIGAHADGLRATLVTLDDGHYRRSFPRLRVLVP